MPAPHKLLSEGLEAHPENKDKVRYMICSPLVTGKEKLSVKYMNCTSVVKHINSKSHQTQVQVQQEEKQQRSEAERIFKQMYQDFIIPPNQELSNCQPIPKPNLFNNLSFNCPGALPSYDAVDNTGGTYHWDQPIILTLHEHPIEVNKLDEEK
ncbi:hypothetical protein ARMGADRAFT_1033542 [Armillaria gallica]|uniref:Uncharacterized protein n=1 Tax=Armillaria gallica TaxID=47427 RepID=A0A2H3D4A3_ARMGA|nr:hypothetical protein ARMGADRAFT_1033542 [Armillaria gallica]